MARAQNCCVHTNQMNRTLGSGVLGSVPGLLVWKTSSFRSVIQWAPLQGYTSVVMPAVPPLCLPTVPLLCFLNSPPYFQRFKIMQPEGQKSPPVRSVSLHQMRTAAAGKAGVDPVLLCKRFMRWSPRWWDGMMSNLAHTSTASCICSFTPLAHELAQSIQLVTW